MSIETVYDVIRKLAAAAFGGGQITDAEHAQIQEVVNKADPKVAEDEQKQATTVTDAEQAEYDRLKAKIDASHAAEQPAQPAEPVSPVAPGSAQPSSPPADTTVASPPASEPSSSAPGPF